MGIKRHPYTPEIERRGKGVRHANFWLGKWGGGKGFLGGGDRKGRRRRPRGRRKERRRKGTKRRRASETNMKERKTRVGEGKGKNTIEMEK